MFIYHRSKETQCFGNYDFFNGIIWLMLYIDIKLK